MNEIRELAHRAVREWRELELSSAEKLIRNHLEFNPGVSIGDIEVVCQEVICKDGHKIDMYFIREKEKSVESKR